MTIGHQSVFERSKRMPSVDNPYLSEALLLPRNPWRRYLAERNDYVKLISLANGRDGRRVSLVC